MSTTIVDQGNVGEAIAAHRLTVIFDGECTKESMRGEGLGALDLQLKFYSTFPSETFTQVAVQVKTGPSFGQWTESKNRFRLQNIKDQHLEKWRNSNQPVLLIWINPTPSEKIYWKLITKKTPLETLSVSKNHELTPASRFEIERLLNAHKTGPSNIEKIHTHALISTSEIREWARKKFYKLRGHINSPLGNIQISNYAWRHLTRITRPQSHIQDSLTALPYVKIILRATPHQIQTQLVVRLVEGGKVKIHNKVLAIYRDVRFSDKEVCVVYVRLDEKIEHSANWRETSLIKKKTRHDLILESIFRKLS